MNIQHVAVSTFSALDAEDDEHIVERSQTLRLAPNEVVTQQTIEVGPWQLAVMPDGSLTVYALDREYAVERITVSRFHETAVTLKAVMMPAVEA